MGHYDEQYEKEWAQWVAQTENNRQKEYDNVNKPFHYNQFPVEVIELTEHLNFCRGNVVKYVCRAHLKNNELEDLKKAKWYLEREINRVIQQQNPRSTDDEMGFTR